MRFFQSLILILLAALSACQNAVEKSDKIDLSGSWQFQKQGDSIWLPALVPGTVQTDLFANQLIQDPYYSDNESKNKWVENENWVYQKTFEVDKSDLKQNAELVFEGLDTYATVFLNGRKILDADNMFRTFKVDVDSFLIEGENELKIIFESPVQKAIPIYDALPYRLPADNDRNEKQTSVFTRKAAYQYGWDWGPRYVSMGIWRPIVLHFWENFRVIENRVSQQKLSKEEAVVVWFAKIVAEKEAVLSYRIGTNSIRYLSKTIRLQKGENTITDTFRVQNPKLWWPNGYGEQNIYSFHVDLKSKNQHFSERKQLGFRTIEHISESDSIGKSFYFRVNGIPIYAKGANYIPQDNFLPNADSSRYKELIKSVKDANMNMLRVWGGGIYESDLFYDLCDRNGILVWQDFMFACSLYPGDSAFLKNVEMEARDNIVRLRNHPSLALWCGNNEINELWYNWGYQKKLDYSEEDSIKIWNDYQKLFNHLLPNLVKELNPETAYWESSPMIGWGHSESMNQGDSHYWGVWWGKETFEVYEEKVPRFASEFGFQSIPQRSTIESFADSNQMNLFSTDLKAHQKSSIGNETILEYMQRNFPVPEQFDDFVYVSQLVQAYGMSIAFEAQRRNKPKTMGSLYWQLNDCWPGISWSGLDYFGNWKALHYEAQHDFKTFLISFENQSDGLSVFVISDSLKTIKARLELVLMDFDGKRMYDKTIDLSVSENSANEVFQIPNAILDKVLESKKMLLSAKLYSHSKLMAENNYYFSSPKELILPNDVELAYKMKGNLLSLWSKNGKLIKNLYLQANQKAVFSKNFFDLLPGDTVYLSVDKQNSETFRLKFKSLHSL